MNCGEALSWRGFPPPFLGSRVWPPRFWVSVAGGPPFGGCWVWSPSAVGPPFVVRPAPSLVLGPVPGLGCGPGPGLPPAPPAPHQFTIWGAFATQPSQWDRVGLS